MCYSDGSHPAPTTRARRMVMMVSLFIIQFILFHAFQQAGEIVEVARVNT